jgi:hypothetical protein
MGELHLTRAVKIEDLVIPISRKAKNMIDILEAQYQKTPTDGYPSFIYHAMLKAQKEISGDPKESLNWVCQAIHASDEISFEVANDLMLVFIFRRKEVGNIVSIAVDGIGILRDIQKELNTYIFEVEYKLPIKNGYDEIEYSFSITTKSDFNNMPFSVERSIISEAFNKLMINLPIFPEFKPFLTRGRLLYLFSRINDE